MSESNNTVLSRMFTQNIFKDLINGKPNEVYNTCIKRYLNTTNEIENKIGTNLIYKFLMKEYRNEYFYKNTLLTKLLLGRHSLKTTVALTEIPILRSKADFILINGKAVVYEIKTELDSFERLNNQVNDYFSAFNNVCVVTCESNYIKLSNLLCDTNIGICILTNKNTINTRKEPIEDNSKLNHKAMFGILRKKEFEYVITNHFGELPKTNQFNYYKECLKLFENIDIAIAYKYFLIELKKRNINEVDEYMKVPPELKFLVYFSNYKRNDYIKLNAFLEMNFRG